MKKLSLISLLLLTGCAYRRIHLWIDDNPQHQACRYYHYCSDKAGKVLVGDRVCYTNDITADPLSRFSDLKCLP